MLKAGKQETFPNFGKLTEGKRFRTLSIPKWKYGNTKNCAKKNMEFRLKVLRKERPDTRFPFGMWVTRNPEGDAS